MKLTDPENKDITDSLRTLKVLKDLIISDQVVYNNYEIHSLNN